MYTSKSNRGRGEPLEGDRPTIPIRKDDEFLDQVKNAVDDVVARVDKTLNIWDENVGKFGDFAEDMADEERALFRSSLPIWKKPRKEWPKGREPLAS